MATLVALGVGSVTALGEQLPVGTEHGGPGHIRLALGRLAEALQPVKVAGQDP